MYFLKSLSNAERKLKHVLWQAQFQSHIHVRKRLVPEALIWLMLQNFTNPYWILHPRLSQKEPGS